MLKVKKIYSTKKNKIKKHINHYSFPEFSKRSAGLCDRSVLQIGQLFWYFYNHTSKHSEWKTWLHLVISILKISFQKFRKFSVQIGQPG